MKTEHLSRYFRTINTSTENGDAAVQRGTMQGYEDYLAGREDLRLTRSQAWPDFKRPFEKHDTIIGERNYVRSMVKLIVNAICTAAAAGLNGENISDDLAHRAEFVRLYQVEFQRWNRPLGREMKIVREILFPTDEMKTAMHGAANDEARTTFAYSYIEVANAMVTAIDEEFSRIIGKAITSAAPNHQFDAHLGPATGY